MYLSLDSYLGKLLPLYDGVLKYMRLTYSKIYDIMKIFSRVSIMWSGTYLSVGTYYLIKIKLNHVLAYTEKNIQKNVYQPSTTVIFNVKFKEILTMLLISIKSMLFNNHVLY